MNQEITMEKLLQFLGELYVKDRIVGEKIVVLEREHQKLKQENEKLKQSIEQYEKDITPPSYPD